MKTPPIAPRRPRTTEIHGRTLVDDYHWLRNRDDPEVITYLEAENAHTEAYMEPTGELRERLYREMLSRIQETDLSVPVRLDDCWYYSRTEEGKQYPIHCRRRGGEEAPEEVLLDENALAEGHDYFALGAYVPSPDHRLLAYATDTAGDERYVLRIRDLASGTDLPHTVPNTSGSVAWYSDNRTLLYVVLDGAHRPYRVLRHVLDTSAGQDEVVHEEGDPAFFVGVSRARSRRYLILASGSSTSSEDRFVPADDPSAAPRLVRARRPGVEYDTDHRGDHFYIATNDGDAVNFKVVRAPVDDPGRWEDAVPHREAVKVEGVDAFRDHLVVYKRQDGFTGLEIRRFDTGDAHDVEFPEPVLTVAPGANPEFDTAVLRFHYASPVTPPSVFDYDMESRTPTLLKETEVPGGYDRSRYATERIFAVAPDGTRIPVSVLHRRDLVRDGSAPCLLYGYGSYGITVDPGFSSTRFSLVDRGFVFAIAHIRGGGAMGRPWYHGGRLGSKPNTFTDFIACAEHLVAEKYTSSARLATMGGSAGGLLMGAVLNLRPELFAAAVAQVPFVDVVNTMLDDTLPLTVIEYDEWGNPNDPEAFETMFGYSPYDNVADRPYPALLVTAGLNDPRVQYWEPAKWVARMRAVRTDDRPLLLRTEMGQGHGGASGRYDRLREIAFDYAFLIHALGVDDPQPA